VPVLQFYLVPTSTGDWAAHGATFGKVSSKKQTIFGYKLHLLITLGGIILDFELAPANAADLHWLRVVDPVCWSRRDWRQGLYQCPKGS
jgi:hypothetical protein